MTNEVSTENTSLTQASPLLVDKSELMGLNEMEEDIALTESYRTAEEWDDCKDQDIRCFFMGMDTIPNEDGEVINCGVFVTEKETFMSGAMTLVKAVKNLPRKTPILIKYKGKKKNATSNGSTMIFEVKRLV